MSAKDADYQYPNNEILIEGANVVQNALCEISKATEKIQKSTRESRKLDWYDQDPKYAHLATVAELRTYKEAMESDATSEWESAAQTEMETIEANRT